MAADKYWKFSQEGDQYWQNDLILRGIHSTSVLLFEKWDSAINNRHRHSNSWVFKARTQNDWYLNSDRFIWELDKKTKENISTRIRL